MTSWPRWLRMRNKRYRRHGRSYRSRSRCDKVAHITKRRLGIVEIGTIIKRGAVILLQPAFFHAELFQGGLSAHPFRLADSARQEGVALISSRHVGWIVLGHERHHDTRAELVMNPL